VTGPLSAILGSGLLGVFCIASVEKIFPAPPSHIVLLFLGMTAAPGLDRLELLLLVTVAGSTLGSLFWYAMGLRLGEARADAFVKRFGRYVFLPLSTYRKLAETYRRKAFVASLVAQLIPTVRNYLGIGAGALRLPVLAFASATLLGATIWNSAFLVIGYLMRGTDHNPVSIGFRIIAIVVLVEATFFLVLRYRSTRRRRAELAGG
jgi:membrane protein DedA with SNARE-associated domain